MFKFLNNQQKQSFEVLHVLTVVKTSEDR